MSIRPTARDLWKRGQRGWPASFPLAQGGVNWARRGIGAAALLFVVARIAAALRT